MVRDLIAVVVLLAGLLPGQQQEFRTASIFGDHMVLPAACEVALRGFGPADATVRVEPSWGDAVTAVVAADGRWQVRLRTGARGEGGNIALACGAAKASVEDVLFGDVWLASGQSNMEMTLGSVRGDRDIDGWEQAVAAATHDDLRVFTVTRRTASAPADDVEGRWQRCTPEAAQRLSAVGYFFARDLLRAGKGPIGLVVSSWGGTPVEAWTSPEALAPFDEFADDLASLRAADGGAARAKAQREQFFAAIGTAKPAGAPTTVELPRRWSDSDLRGFDGAVDYARSLELPADFVGKDLVLELGAIDDMDRVFWNGSRVAGSEVDGVWNRPRRYRIPASHVSGRLVDVVLRVVDTGGEGGLTGEASAMRLVLPGDEGQVAAELPLAGEWRRLVRASIEDLPRWPRSGLGASRPGVLYLGMIAPLLPFPFAGVIWYQGESNRGAPELYARTFPAMIRDWRSRIGSDVPFYFVQIAPYEYGDQDGDARTARLRASQAAALQLPATGMVVTLDCGEAADIHPRTKQPVGARLALLARAGHYGDDVVAAAPTATRATRLEDGSVRVDFVPPRAVEPVAADADAPGAFEFVDADGSVHPATAERRNGALVLHCEGSDAPATVRYAWASAPVCRLRCEHGLPVAPFELSVR